MNDEQNKIWNYYRELAREDGAKEKDADGNVLEWKFYSMHYFFPEADEEFTPNAFVRAFLGDDIDDELPPLLDADDLDTKIKSYICADPKPYPAQLEAIKNALTSRVSIVQGPPGTGKTEMIINLLSVIHGVDPQATVAVLSSNNEALENIFEKLEESEAREQKLAELKNYVSKLGSQSFRKAWESKLKRDTENAKSVEDAGYFYEDKKFIKPEYLDRRPIFTSTVNSLLTMFRKQGDLSRAPFFLEYNMFDYIIIDECSQLSVVKGVAAMSHVKKSFVLVGDNNQLKPIIKNNVEADISDIYKEKEGKSFLGVCEEIFGKRKDSFEAKTVLLNEHYRCHPSIIQFCNENVYENKLNIKTKDDGSFRMRAVWYEGAYCEYLYSDDKEDEEDKETRKKLNQKQINIFLREELPRILANPNLSVAVICPYREELNRLLKKLKRVLRLLKVFRAKKLEEAKVEIEEIEETNIYALTIHKSQGKGYDVVYMLTVDDYYQEDPWSQRIDLINVAVSRAKKEFCIIASARWLPEIKQNKFNGYALRPSEKEKYDPENFFYCKLMQYISDNTDRIKKEKLGEYGLHKTQLISVFDRIPYYQEQIRNKKLRTKLSAPELCMKEVLKK